MRIQTRLILSVILASLPAASVSLAGADANGKPGKWQVLFDGKSVDNWRGYKLNSFPDHSWKVEAGSIKTIAGADGPDIVTREKFGNFELNQLIARSKFKDMPRFAKENTGFIDLQHHGDEVWYRRIRVRRL